MKISARTVILQVEKRTTMLEKCHTMLFMAAIECHAKCSAAMWPFVFFSVCVFFFCLSEIAMFYCFSWSFMCLTPLKLSSSLSTDELEEKEKPCHSDL